MTAATLPAPRSGPAAYRARVAAHGWVLTIDRDGLVYAVPGYLYRGYDGSAGIVQPPERGRKVLLGAVDPHDPYGYRRASNIAVALGWRVTGEWTTAGRNPACVCRPPAIDPPRTPRGVNHPGRGM